MTEDKQILKFLSAPVDEGGCGQYRVRQPFEMIKEFTDHDAYILTAADDGYRMVQAASSADVCVVRQGGEAMIDKLKEFPEFDHLKYVLDIDDNVEMISPYSQHYKEYGVEEFYDSGVKDWLWKNGRDGFELSGNRVRLVSLLKGLQKADMVTVTTEKLAEYARKYNPNVRVLPNCVDTRKWWKPNRKPNETLRVGWSGGISHYEDWYGIREPLNKLLRELKFTLVMVGTHFEGLIDEDNRQRVETWPWVPFPAHSFRMMCMGLDAAIVPLADLPFNHYKSPIKLVEFAAMGVPSVVASVGPYKLAGSEIMSMPYKTPEEFHNALKAILTHNKLRRDIGERALKDARKYDAEKNAHLWTDAYQSLLDVKE